MQFDSRRDFLRQSTAMSGLGSIALSWLASRDASAADRSPIDTPALGKPHFEPKAKSVIFIFAVGGASQMDLFDPKPDLAKFAGKPLPPSFGKPASQFTKGDSVLMPSKRKFARHGQSGMWMSDLMPHLAGRVDDIAFLHSCQGTSTIHAPALYELHTGRTQMGFPSLGSWVTYGLGSESENLPAYCVLPQPEGVPEGGAPCWGSGFLPAIRQGTLLRRGSSPVLNLKPANPVSDEQQRRTFDLVRDLSKHQSDPDDGELTSRIGTYELAWRMQKHASEAVDLTRETAATRAKYGVDSARTADFGTRCLLARRLVERGVRFVQLYSGGGPLSTQWDAHDDVDSNHETMCGRVDRPIAALLEDLKSRGMLKDTLVVFATEFGRTPFTQGGLGRDHNPWGFTMWMAGGGVKGGQAIGATDEFGLRAIKNKIAVHDFHATILHLLGMDHERLTYRINGRDERLTDVAGEVVSAVLG